MLTAGRLKRIKSYISPSNENQSASILNKFCHELVDEVERLRSVLQSLANAHPRISDPRVMASHAADALKESELGPPDFVCQRFSVLDKEESQDIRKDNQ